MISPSLSLLMSTCTSNSLVHSLEIYHEVPEPRCLRTEIRTRFRKIPNTFSMILRPLSVSMPLCIGAFLNRISEILAKRPGSPWLHIPRKPSDMRVIGFDIWVSPSRIMAFSRWTLRSKLGPGPDSGTCASHAPHMLPHISAAPRRCVSTLSCHCLLPKSKPAVCLLVHETPLER